MNCAKKSLSWVSTIAFICLAVIPLFVGSVFAQEPINREVLETEIEAKQLSKEWSGETYRRSIELFLKTSDDWLKLGETANATECLREAARLNFLLTDYSASKLLLKKAVQLDKSKNYAASEAKSHSLMSLILLQEGEIKQSEISSKKAVELAVSSQDFAAQANAFYSAAVFSYFQKDADETVKLFEEARSFGEKTADLRLNGDILLELSYAYMKQGNPVAALKTAEESLLTRQKDNDKRGEAFSFQAIGLAFKMLGEEQNALDYCYKAELMFPQDIDFIEQARLLTVIAAVYDKYGDDKLLEKNMQKAYLLFQKAEYPQGQLAVLPTLIKLSYATKQSNLAEKYYEQVKVLSQKLKNDFILANTEETIGNERLKNNLTDEAVVFFNSALTGFQRLKNKQFTALVNQRLGEAFLKQEKYEAAKEKFASALEFNREIKDGFAESQNLYFLAKLNLALNNYDEALKDIKESIILTETLYSSVNNSKLRQVYFSSIYDRYELYINLLMKMHARFPDQNFDLQAFQVSEKSRTRSMLENLSLSEAKFTKDANPETVKREKEIRNLLNLKSDKLTDLLSGSAEKAEVEKLDGEIRELDNELAEIKATLKQNSPFYSAIKNPAPFDVAEFQAKVLDDKTLLLEFSLGKEESYLWLIGKNEVHSYVLPPQLQIETKIIKLRDLIASREVREGETIEDYQSRIFKADQFYWSEAHELSNELFGQIADKIAGKRLIIVPDGKLHYFPISALPLPNSASDEPLLFANETIYEPSASTLLLLSKNPNQTSADKDLLVFSDPIFTENDSRISAGNNAPENAETASLVNLRFAESLNNLPRLAASREEGDAAAAIFGASKADIFSGFAATREKVLSSATSDYKIVHFATHGLVNDERPELSGIVLSGFDETGGKLEQVVRLQDIYGLNLNADLVVLSACKTGVGKEVRGEGLQSLANGFLNVGAKSVVSSLWKVDDNATKELMTHFYRGLAEEKLTTSEALRRAQIKLAQNPRFKSPFYWAAFTLQGDFQNTPKIATGFGYWVYGLLVVPILLILIYGIRKFNGTRTSVRR